MPDSNALRSRRKRAHAAGDHHLCKHWPQPAPVSLAPPPEPGDGFDPGLELRKLAGRLAAAYAADTGNAALARELRQTLLAISAPGEDNELAELMRTFAEGT
jgi:hypothetical protein